MLMFRDTAGKELYTMEKQLKGKQRERERETYKERQVE
jgi:hypothetical protein